MRRNELSVGQPVEILHGNKVSWHSLTDGAVVVSVLPYREVEYNYGIHDRYRPAIKSAGQQGVAIAKRRVTTDYDDDGNVTGQSVRWEPDVVQLRKVFPAGTSDRLKAEYDVAAAAAKVQAIEADKRRAARSAQIDRIEALVKARVPTGAFWGNYSGSQVSVNEASLDLIEALLLRATLTDDVTTTCSATKTNGKPCPNTAKYGSLCGVHANAKGYQEIKANRPRG